MTFLRKNSLSIPMNVLFTVLFFALPTFAIQGGMPLPKDWSGRSPVVRIGSGERDNPISKCSGVLLNSRVIVTAAHCFLEFSYIRKLSIENLETGARFTSTFKTIAKPGYQTQFHDKPNFKNIGYDIGLIILRWDVPFKLPVIDLAKEDRDLNLAIPNIWLIANGSQKPHWDSSSASLPITEIVKHSFEGKEAFFQFKSAQAKAGPCEGDSGGGIFSWKDGAWTLEGIQSTKRAEPACDHDFNRGYFVPIYPNRGWIQSVLKGI